MTLSPVEVAITREVRVRAPGKVNLSLHVGPVSPAPTST